MSETLYRHRLDGLEADNLLAFLALLGLLRALETVRPQWRPRAAWDLDHPPLRPVLTLAEPTSIGAICEAAAEGVSVFRRALLPFSWQKNKQGRANKPSLCRSIEKYRLLAERIIATRNAAILKNDEVRSTIWKMRLDLLSSGVCEIWSEKQHDVEASPLKLPSGRMSFIGAMFEAASACGESDIERSLFHPWEFRSKGDSLRLAFQEAVRYAYRATDPSPEGARSERGATALGAIGLLAYGLVPRGRYLGMLAYSGERKEGWISWPIWSFGSGAGASYSAIVALLTFLHSGMGEQWLEAPEEVVGQVQAKRFVLDPRQGDYGNITRGELIWRNRWRSESQQKH